MPWKPRVGTPGSWGWQAARTLYSLQTGNDALEEIRDPLPGDVGRDLSGPGQRRILAGIGQPPRAVARAAPTGSRPGSQDPQEAHVVLERRNPGLGAGRDHLLNVFDVAIALGTFPQHDCAAGLVVDMARRQEWQGHHVQRDAVLSHRGHASAADRRRSRLPLAPGSGGYPQMWLTPCRLKYCSIRGVVGPCWVPTCIFTGLPERLRPSGSGATPPARVASPRSSAAPVPMSETNDLRFITTTPGYVVLWLEPTHPRCSRIDSPSWTMGDGPALRIGQAELGGDAERLVDRGGQALGADRMVDGVGGVLVGAAVGGAAADPGAGQDGGEERAPVAAAPPRRWPAACGPSRPGPRPGSRRAGRAGRGR